MLLQTRKIYSNGKILLSDYIIVNFCSYENNGECYAYLSVIDDKLCMTNNTGYRVRVYYDNRITIPVAIRRQLGIKSQDVIDIVLEKDILVFKQRNSVADDVCTRIEKELIKTTDKATINNVIRIVRHELQVS